MLQLQRSGTCPSKALYCSLGAARRTGLVEGQKVQGILLDTGYSHTMIRKDLVAEEKYVPGR